jgi:two-component system, OmpR family, aerobic respiration control sensor histidine kinase ArcB
MTNEKKLQVLVVEDNELAICALSAMLRKLNCDVDVARNGLQATERFDNHYDLVILDIGLPDIDGFQIGKLIRYQPSEIATTPIVGLSAHACDETYYEQGYKLGFNGFFNKPLSFEACETLLAGIARGEKNFWDVENKL